MQIGKSRHMADKPFPAPVYGSRYWASFYLNRPIFELRGRKFAIRHALALGVSLTLLAIWHLLLATPASELLGGLWAFRIGLILWVVCLGSIFVSFLVTPDNKRRFLVWFGLLPPETRKAQIGAPNDPRMRAVSRLASYFIIGGVAAAYLWWASTFLLYVYYGEWATQLYMYTPTLVAMVFLGAVAALNLDRMWIFRRTKLPMLVALAALFVLLFVVYRWGVVELGWQWYFGPNTQA